MGGCFSWYLCDLNCSPVTGPLSFRLFTWLKPKQTRVSNKDRAKRETVRSTASGKEVRESTILPLKITTECENPESEALSGNIESLFYANGSLGVYDRGSGTVQKLTSNQENSAYVVEADLNLNPLTFAIPTAVTCDESNAVYVCDWYAHNIKKVGTTEAKTLLKYTL